MWSTKFETATKGIKNEKRRYMAHDEVKHFYDAIRSDPVLIQRFLTVPIDTVHILADKILDLLSTPWKEGLDDMIMPFFEQKIMGMGNILEREVDALFMHFIDQYEGPVDNLAIDFWLCLKEEEKVVSSTSGDNDEDIKNLHNEVNQNPWLKSRFSSMSQTLFAEKIKEMINVLVGKVVITELSEDVEKLRKMKITEMEFDEFTKLYFKMCSPYPEYLAEVWPNLVKIKKAIMPTSPIKKRRHIGLNFNKTNILNK